MMNLNKLEPSPDRKSWRPYLLMGLLAAYPAASMAQLPRADDVDEDEEDIIELSPFEVNTDEDVGYLATSSLSGSRLNTELRDVAAAVQVVTPEFMEDTGATNLGRVLLYTTNTEVAGIEGNFYGGDTWDKDHARDLLVEPHRTTRIRGLNTADITRDFFPTDLPIDWYSLARVDISRGPNAVLFGLGSPAGLINNTLKAPLMSKSAYSAEFRVDKYGSMREVVDIDYAIIPEVLGLRVVGLYDDARFRQDYTFNTDRRLYAAMRWQPKLGNGVFTQVDVNAEWGVIKGNRPVAGTPGDFVTNFYVTNKNTVLNDEYWTDPGDPGFGSYEALYAAQSIGGQVWDDHPITYFSDPTNGEIGFPNGPDAMIARGQANVNGGGWGAYVGLTNTNWELWNPNHRLNQKATFADNAILTGIINDYEAQTGNTFAGFGQGLWPTQMIIDGPIAQLMQRQNVIGPNKREFNSFEDFNIVTTQSYWDGRIGWNFAYNKQHYRSGYQNAIEGLWGGNIVSIDINESLRGGYGANENVGRLYTVGEGRGAIWEKDRENWRLTSYLELNAEDFLNPDGWMAKIVGDHTFTGVLSSQRFHYFDRNYAMYRWDEDYLIGRNWHGYATWRGVHYLSDDLRDTNSMADYAGRISGITTHQDPTLSQSILYERYNSGDGSWAYGVYDTPLLSYKTDLDRLYDGAGEGHDQTKSKVFVWQGSLLGGVIVPIFGWREDEYEQFLKPSNLVRDPDYDYVLPWSTDWTYPNEPSIYAKEERRSWSVALHGKELMELFDLSLPSVVSDFTVLYNNSSSFRPSDVAVDVYNQQEANPSGETEDVSILVSAFNDRLSLRVTKYRTIQKNTPFIGDAPAFNRNKAVLGRSMDGMMWEIGGHFGALPSEGGTPAEERYQPTPEWLVNKWMFGDSYDKSIEAEPLPFDWRDNPDILNQPLRIRHAAVPGDANYVAQGDINPDSGLAWVAPPLNAEEIAYRTEWFQARTMAEWARPVGDQAWWEAVDFNQDWTATWGGAWEISAWEVPSNSRSLNDLESTGIEYELTANPTPNWRITLNASKAEAVRSNVLASWDAYIGNSMDFWFDGGYSLNDVPAMDYWSFKGFYDIPEAPGNQLGGSGRLGTGYATDILAKYYQAKATENQLVNELRKWHFNLVTNYSFSSGPLKGFGVGGAYRWMDKSNLGYYPKYDADSGAWVNDVENPIKGSSEDYLDVWLSYERDIGRGMTWSVQLNVYDVFAQDNLIPTAANPDGTIAQVRLPGETTWSLSNVIRF